MRRLPFLPRISLGLACVFSLVLSAGCASDQSVISQAEQIHGGLKPAVMEDPQLAGYLQALGARIIASAQVLDGQKFGPDSHRSADSAWMFSSQMQFHLVNSKTLNAFTTGGDHMYIYSELFETCRSEDELAAVMAHEYAHVYCRHVHKGMNRQYVMLGGVLAAGGAGYAAGGKEHGDEYAQTFASAAAAAGQFIGMSYTRGDEAEADALGFVFYSKSGWDPNRFGDFFQQLIDKGMDTTPEMLSDHPSLKSRVTLAQQHVGQLPAEAAGWRKTPIADAQQFAQLKARTAQVAKAMPTSESLEKAQTLLSSFQSCVSPKDQPDQVKAREKLRGGK